MKPRTIFWAVAFVLPVAVAVGFTVSLQRERAALLAQIARLGAQQPQRLAAQQEVDARIKDLDAQRAALGVRLAKTLAEQKAALEADREQLAAGASAWQRRQLAVELLANQLAAGGDGSAGGASAHAPLAIVQFSNARPYFRELLGDVTYARAVLALMKQRAETEMGRLLAALHLEPAAQDKLEDLLAQRDMAEADAAGLNTGSGTGVLMRSTRTAIAEEIKTTFGPEVNEQFLDANNNIRFNFFVDDMASRLSYTPDPLTTAQQDQLVGILDQAFDGGKGNLSRWIIPDAIVAQAQGFLTPPQLKVLRQIQAEQQGGIQGRPNP